MSRVSSYTSIQYTNPASEVVFIAPKAECEAASLAIRLVQDKTSHYGQSAGTKVMFIVSKAECEAASLAIKLVQDKSLWAECVPQQSCSLFQRWSARRPASLLTQFNLNY